MQLILKIKKETTHLSCFIPFLAFHLLNRCLWTVDFLTLTQYLTVRHSHYHLSLWQTNNINYSTNIMDVLADNCQNRRTAIGSPTSASPTIKTYHFLLQNPIYFHCLIPLHFLIHFHSLHCPPHCFHFQTQTLTLNDSQQHWLWEIKVAFLIKMLYFIMIIVAFNILLTT